MMAPGELVHTLTVYLGRKIRIDVSAMPIVVYPRSK